MSPMKKFTSKAKAAPEPDREFAFELDQVAFTCTLRADADAVMEWSELAATAASGDADLDSPEGTAFIARFFKLMMPPAQYARFRAHMKRSGTDQDVLVEIMQAIQEEMTLLVEDTAERPTGPPSPSPSGRTAKDERTLQLLSMAGDDGDIVLADPPADAGERKAG